MRNFFPLFLMSIIVLVVFRRANDIQLFLQVSLFMLWTRGSMYKIWISDDFITYTSSSASSVVLEYEYCCCMLLF